MAGLTRDGIEPGGRHGRLARLGIGAQVALSGALALAAVLMVNWLAGRPGLRQRFDLTATEQNTLSTATMGVLERLPGEVTIDVFFRPEPGLLEQVAYQAMDRTRRLLGLFRDLSGERVAVRHNDMGDPAAIEERRRALKLRGIENCLVVSYEGAREVVRLIGGLAYFDPGQPPPDYRSPRIVEFRAEEAVTQALLKVTRGEVLEVYFSAGHGELEVLGVTDEDDHSLTLLQGLLADEGLRVGSWNPHLEPDLPADCACLSIINPRDPLSDETLDAVTQYVQAGGRLVVAPSSDDDELERSRLNELLARFDLEVQQGVVCQPRRDPQTGQPLWGQPANGILAIHPDRMSRHPLLEPIRLEQRTFGLALAHPVRFTGQPARGVSAPLFTSEVSAWVDMPPLNFQPDQGEVARGRPFELAIASQFRPEGAEVPLGLEQEVEARIVLIGGAYTFTNSIFRQNQDFLRNLYNWVLAREYRLSMSPRPPDIRLIQDVDQLPRINQIVWGWLPGLCLALGLLAAFLRSRGAPRAHPS